ncbi:MAG: zinc ABC transporter substrate-binding protein [Ilumatobacter sp.]|nr:zinc ABC transporter substrate-binding protein [Ilumatobacter sp.]
MTEIVVTTAILGDIVTAALGEMVGDTVAVDVVMPPGADPHEFAPSARDAEAMENADVLVVNGLAAEGAMTDIIANVRDGGTDVFTVTDALRGRLIDGDPHVWLDPDAMATAVTAFADALVAATDLDRAAVERNVAVYVDELRALDESISTTLAPIPPSRRALVTDHDALAYFARRYGFTVNGTVISSVSTTAEASAADLETLAALIRDEGLPAIFVETSESDRLARAVADAAGGDVAVVRLFTGSLGAPGSGADTYIGAMLVNAERIAEALS